MFDFFKTIIQFLNINEIPYMLSGSVAMSLYTLPRATRDFDFVISLDSKGAEKLIEYFGDGYYCSEIAVKDALKNKGMFNIIDNQSGFKADFIILKAEEYRQTEFNRRSKDLFLDIPIFVVTIEDLIISKLIWIQEVQSALQMEDIKQLFDTNQADKQYIDHWVSKLNLKTFNLL